VTGPVEARETGSISRNEARFAASNAGYSRCESLKLTRGDWVCIALRRGKSYNVVIDAESGQFKSAQRRKGSSEDDPVLSMSDGDECRKDLGEDCGGASRVTGEETEAARTCVYTGAECPNDGGLIFNDRSYFRNLPEHY